jgi:hypothetical protein
MRHSDRQQGCVLGACRLRYSLHERRLLARRRRVKRSAFLDIGSSWFAVGPVRARAYQTQLCQIFSGRHPGRNHRGRGSAPLARFAGASRRGDRVHSWDPQRSLRSSFQDFAAKPGRLLSPSVAAAGVAAHEAGHALQDADDYFPMEARTYIVPIVQLASQVAPWLFVGGLLLQLPTLTWIGVILFGSSSSLPSSLCR